MLIIAAAFWPTWQTTSRSSTGITPRPNTGTTTRPGTGITTRP